MLMEQNMFRHLLLMIHYPLKFCLETYVHCIFHLSYQTIAIGYIVVQVNAKTEIWNPVSQKWVASDTATYRPVIYVESPYKQLYENEQAQNQQLQEQINDLQE